MYLSMCGRRQLPTARGSIVCIRHVISGGCDAGARLIFAIHVLANTLLRREAVMEKMKEVQGVFLEHGLRANVRLQVGPFRAPRRVRVRARAQVCTANERGLEAARGWKQQYSV